MNDQEMIQKRTYVISGNELTITLDGLPKKYIASFKDNELTSVSYTHLTLPTTPYV